VWDLVFETLTLKFNCDGARAGRMPKRWHTTLILEDKQDTGQIFYARKLQMLDRISAHMTTLCVRPCFRDPSTKINHDKAHAGRMPKRWHTRLILEDKQDTGQIFYAKKLQMLDHIGAHMTTVCVRPCFRDPPTQIQSWRSARRQNAKKVAHKTDIRGQAEYWADILCQKTTDSRSYQCTHDDFVCQTLFSRPSHSKSIVTRRTQAECKKVAHKTDIRGQAVYWADILQQKNTDSQSHWCSHDDCVCETLFSRPSHSNSIVTERAQVECQKGGTQDWY